MSKDWWRGAVIYQIYPRSFQDDSGDGIGDLEGITRRLDHVASLGVDAIWLSPIFTSPMADMGYDVSDYRDIDPQFGTLADFDALVAKAHSLGLKVIIDQVISHSSDQHPWFKEAKKGGAKKDWYVWADPKPDGSPPNNWQAVFGGSAWEWAPERGQYYLHNFLIEQPDLNLHNPEVQDELLDVLRFWLDRGVDGFRLDTVNYYFHDRALRDNPAMTPDPDRWPPISTYDMQDHEFDKNRPENLDFLKRMRGLLDRYEDRTLIGEVGEAPHRALGIMAAYTAGQDRLHMAYSFDMLGPKFTPAHFRSRIEGFFEGAPDGWPSWSFSNHDVQRHVTRWAKYGAPDAIAKLVISMLASFQGTIGIYQGEELGQTETGLEYHELTDPPGLRFWPENKGRDGCRTPMVWDDGANAGFSSVKPWLPVKPEQAARAVALQEPDETSVLAHYRRVLAFRKDTPLLRSGRSEFLDLPEPILGFDRIEGETRLTCLFNLGPAPVTIDAPGGTLTGPCLAASLDDGRLTLGPNGAAWLER
ncbi:alpha-amylase family glycosyl hydrolase [Thioclava atlantica]|uniref:Family 13 glycosyl hydrolase n=1 Tax=Thioclava atlantica TaxID=1317124 RepID=A0A085TX46_9RHOB|nr:alpha-amylase family glycosyl hydrolase [Thioclava atlantica]KFE35293.1 family 13 glycosyl hydrolase [Thioclava atlantica]